MFDLSALLTGHSADVRCCCMDAQGRIITGSRDNTAAVWEQKPGTDENTPAGQRWTIVRKLEGHSGFINSVAPLKETPEFPQGLIVTGGQDKIINVYCPDITEPIRQLIGHTEGVTCVSTGWNGTLLSGSADCTVRVWEDFTEKEVLKGHSAPIWDVAIYPGRGTYLSASGDKTIRLWRNGKEETVYSGHLDAVRKLSVLLDETFLSCSNDGAVRHWNVSGACLNVCQLGSNFLYSMCALPGGFAVTGEGGNLYILNEEGTVSQGVQVPALSVWCCAPLPDGDVIVGGSDGVARIFSQHPMKHAPKQDREALAEQLASQKHSKQALGDLELSKLQGPEALNKGGTEGQTLMINRAGTVEVYQFSGGSWQNLGIVQDAYDADKHELEGVKYDHVVTVDVADNSEPLKLGCNKEDDPWVVAQDFISKHLLPQAYLTEIAEYIMKNTGIGTKPLQMDPAFTDPYTGAGRYVPQGSTTTSPLKSARYFPEHKLLSEPIPDAAKLIKKIEEFNTLVTSDQRLGDNEIAQFQKVAKRTSEGCDLSQEDLPLIRKLLSWGADRIFPCIDLVRAINKAFPKFFSLDDKLSISSLNAQKPEVSCVRVSLRLLVDISTQHTKHCVDNFVDVVAPALDCLNTLDKKYVSSSLSKVLFNVTCVEADSITSRYILDAISNLLEFMLRELEVKDRSMPQFNLLVGIGNLLVRHEELKECLRRPLLKQLSTDPYDKTKLTARDILAAV